MSSLPLESSSGIALERGADFSGSSSSLEEPSLEESLSLDESLGDASLIWSITDETRLRRGDNSQLFYPLLRLEG